jgi:hypothetical protein
MHCPSRQILADDSQAMLTREANYFLDVRLIRTLGGR